MLVKLNSGFPGWTAARLKSKARIRSHTGKVAPSVALLSRPARANVALLLGAGLIYLILGDLLEALILFLFMTTSVSAVAQETQNSWC